MSVRRYVPIVSWLPRYERSWLPLDAIAGLTLWGLVVPEAMAYAGIAGLPASTTRSSARLVQRAGRGA